MNFCESHHGEIQIFDRFLKFRQTLRKINVLWPESRLSQVRFRGAITHLHPEPEYQNSFNETRLIRISFKFFTSSFEVSCITSSIVHVRCFPGLSTFM